MSKALIRHIALIGIGLYLLALVVISAAFPEHALQLKWVLWGIGEVVAFFVSTALFYPRWKDDNQKRFARKVFWTALAIRAVYAFGMCFYYYWETGIAFEYDAADTHWYHDTGILLSNFLRGGYARYIFPYLNSCTMGFSDQGYVLWLALVYTVFGHSWLGPRLLKALMGAYLCNLIYKLGSRTFGERTGRLAAVMCVFMPILIQVCGVHTKEAELMFLSVFALERMDYLIRSRRYTFWNILVPVLLTALTFGFRTIVGMCLIFAFLAFIILAPGSLVPRRSRIATLAGIAVVFFIFLFSPVGREMRIIYRVRFREMNHPSEQYKEMGMKHSELAKSWYLAPGAFVLPLAPMVEESPDNNKMLNGSSYVRNFLGFFAMLAIVIAFRQRRWRDFALIGAYELSYLGLIAFSFAANSERYHEAAVPLIVLMAGYSMTHLRHKDLKWLYAYCVILFAALVFWNWLKLSARGLV